MRRFGLTFLLLLVFSVGSAVARGTLEGSEILQESRQILMLDREIDKAVTLRAEDLVAGRITALDLARSLRSYGDSLDGLERVAVSQVDRYPSWSLGTRLRSLLLETIWAQQTRVNALLKAAQIESTLGLVKAKPYYASQIKALEAYRDIQAKAYKAFFLDDI